MARAPDSVAPAGWSEVAVRYPYSGADAVGPVTLSVGRGERLLLLGPSGSGKSTLLNTLTGLIPQTIPAEVRGEARLFGEPSASKEPADWAPLVARLFQNAEETLCGMTVADEVAFALENRALPIGEIARRIDRALALVGMQDEVGRRTMSLSGGEKQIVALAAVLAQESLLLVVDEPTAHLAPAAARHLRDLLLKPDGRRSTIIVDHRLDGLIEHIDRVALIGPDGAIAASGSPRGFFRDNAALLRSLGAWMPPAAELDAALGEVGIALCSPPLSMGEAVAALAALPAGRRESAARAARAFVATRLAPPSEPGEIVAGFKNADCAPLFGPTVLRDVSLFIRRGEAVAILGRNGAGKSTLGASIAGLLRLKGGEHFGAAGGMAFQNPENQFLAGSVAEEIGEALPNNLSDAERGHRVEEAISRWRLDGLARRHPYELSQGQKRRLALATLTVDGRWPLLVLDEPTAGLDAAGVATLRREIGLLCKAGHALAIITHDMDFALATCARAVVVGEGGILADGPTAEIMRDEALLVRAGLEPPSLIPLIEWLEGAETPC